MIDTLMDKSVHFDLRMPLQNLPKLSAYCGRVWSRFHVHFLTYHDFGDGRRVMHELE